MGPHDEILHIIMPPVASEEIGLVLVALTERLVTTGLAEWTGGALGGEYGYGAEYENDTFMLHPYCWCERADCPWCMACECEGTYELGDSPQHGEFILTKQCARCATYGDEIPPRAPNFRHKASNSTIHWYKWIGRDMEVELHVPWAQIQAECFASLG